MRSGSIAAILLAGLACVLPGLGRGLEYDEACSLRLALLPGPAAYEGLYSETAPPLSFIILRAWVAAAGGSEAAARLPSAACYLATGLVLWAAAARCPSAAGSTLFPLTAALLWLASSNAALQGGLARMYALGTLCAAGLLYFTISLREAEGMVAARALLGMAVTALAGVLTHYGFGFYLLAFAPLSLLLAPRHARRMALLWCGVALFSAAAVGPLFMRQLNSGAMSYLRAVPWTAGLQAMVYYYASPWPWLWLILAIWLAAATIAARRRVTVPAAGGQSLWPALLLLAAATLLLPLAYSRLATPVFVVGRLSLFALPALALALAKLLTARLPARVNAVFLGLLLLTAIAGARERSRTATIYSDKYTAALLREQSGDGEKVVFAVFGRLPVDYYLARWPDAPAVRTQSYPAELDRHPGWRDMADWQRREAELRSEAAAVIDEFTVSAAPRLWLVVHDDELPSQLLLAAAQARLRCTVNNDYRTDRRRWHTRVTAWERRG